MGNLLWGFVAGLVGAIGVSLLMLLQRRMRLMPDLDIVNMISKMTGSSEPSAWAIHFAIGIVAYGGGFTALVYVLDSDQYLLIGLLIGVIGWVIAMLAVMPMAGTGSFAMKLGAMAPAIALSMHLVLGAVIGLVYAGLAS